MKQQTPTRIIRLPALPLRKLIICVPGVYTPNARPSPAEKGTAQRFATVRFLGNALEF